MQRSVKVQGNWDKGHHENITWINISYFLFHLVNYLIINYNSEETESIELMLFSTITGLGREYALAFGQRGASVVGKLFILQKQQCSHWSSKWIVLNYSMT